MVKANEEEILERKIVNVNAETVSNITSTDFPGHYYGEDNSWNLEEFNQNLKVKFHTNQPYDSSFSLIGVDASIANAFRRILIAEVPSLAIENVYIFNNTSIIQDEVLAHRLGLIPLKGSTEGLRWLHWFRKGFSEENDYNTVVLKLQVRCKWQPNGKDLAARGETDPKKLYIDSNVYAHHLTFEPIGQQEQRFNGVPVVSANPDILIAKLRPGQEIDMELRCIKGIGADHAKFSPVATASYRLLPHIRILRPILAADAKKFARCFPRGVIALDRVSAEEASREGSGYEGHEGEFKAIVADPMKDTVSRECLRHDEFKDKVKLGRIQDHFIYHVESTGQLESDELFLESVRLLKVKCRKVKRALNNDNLG
ncbi:DNA-directed RNA polymerases I and III subunit RPAC1 [Eremomyces bilateralis CBS 781.70]|uniref:DNA-directed RNA polymerases I and III subunit RPAC1 n=1 Tax=Eremomyces bilateralis CBS 781.70 TaxID=1392243 RepID=A0A6G1G6X9_9PEZI|nr:DNA-directed RNA polymerases I and III subunit RPAC1 [Eremomyces bilateralis CBS 781.70]KAF1813772.1 DNA-directed RNA polymerases I and III subunit RPAC1 [Eremomyces bilateralis CBS 781.70]